MAGQRVDDRPARVLRCSGLDEVYSRPGGRGFTLKSEFLQVAAASDDCRRSENRGRFSRFSDVRVEAGACERAWESVIC
jgi:hypothetical protein